MVAPQDILKLAESLGLKPTEVQAGALAVYLGMLKKWNKSTNLVAPHNWREMFSSLVLDSFHLAEFLETLRLPEVPLCLDLGAGAGLPGIPLRVLWQRGTYHLVEVREKRMAFLRICLGTLKLPGTFVLAVRAEDAVQKLGAADLVLSRAFLPWTKLLPLARPMLAANGRLVILANKPPPSLPCGWLLTAQLTYAAVGKPRYFWGLEADSIST